MKKILFYDAKPYDKRWFEKLNIKYKIDFIETKLNEQTAPLAKGYDGICAFVNDDINAATVNALHELGIKVVAMRCAGYSNVDFKAAYQKINVVRVPAYSPYAVAEHAMALLLTLNRKTHKAYNRTRDFNFNIAGLEGMDLHGKTVGIIGTGKIGLCFANICKGFGMKVLAYDAFPKEFDGIKNVELADLFAESDVISLHCPLTEQTRHLLGKNAFANIKSGVFIINTSRGGLIDSEALLEAIDTEKIGGAGLDVYEEESEFFFEDLSGKVIKDDTLSLLVSKPNVLITSHQAFLTEEALKAIAGTTLSNLDDFFGGSPLLNEVCYRCETGKVSEVCEIKVDGRCF